MPGRQEQAPANAHEVRRLRASHKNGSWSSLPSELLYTTSIVAVRAISYLQVLIDIS